MWTLALDYSSALKNLGYSKFLDRRPALAVQHILNRTNHPELRRRASTQYRMNKDDYRSYFARFLRDLAKEAAEVDKHESVTATACPVRDDKPPPSPKMNVNKSKKSGRTKGQRDEVRHGQKRRAPTCLNPKCGKQHFVRDCPITNAEERERLLQGYRNERGAKRRRGNDGGPFREGRVKALNKIPQEENSSMFTATCAYGKVEFRVLADQGAGVSVMPVTVLKKIKAIDKSIEVLELASPLSYSTADGGAHPLTFN